MTFASPHALWLLLAVPLVVAAYVAAQRRRRRYAVRFTNLALLASVVTAMPRWRRHVPPVLSLLALVALVVALARPEMMMRVPREEASVILTMDRSGSMRATDVVPSRLDAARDAARRFVDHLPDGVRIGLVSFSSAVEVLSFPVTDRRTVLDALSSVYADGGTAMGDALSRSVEIATSVKGEQEEQRPSEGDAPVVAVVLLSDGANTTGTTDPLGAAMQAQDAGVPVFTIALGTDEGVVEIPGGRMLPVPPDRETLRQVAEMTGGTAFDAPSEADLNAIYDHLGSRVGFTSERREATATFAGIGAALLAIGAALSLAWFGKLP